MARETVRRFYVGETAHCPADRGEQAYSGRVESIGDDVQRNASGAPFVWVTVRRAGAHASVWPSNRLSGGRLEPVRKTRDVWEVEGNYGQGWEVENTEMTATDGRRSLREYRENGPGSYRLRMRRERIQPNQEA